MESKQVLGIDVGASGIKGGVVDITTGQMLTDRLKLETPKPATPDNIAEVINQLVKLHEWTGPIGCGFPAIIKNGVAWSAANIDPSCIGTNFQVLLTRVTGMPVFLLNDADAAGLAEMRLGKGRGRDGLIILITIGTGLGSAVFMDGKLLPNTELGHFYLKGQVAEKYAANSAREREDLGWEEWGERFKEYLIHLKRLFSPDLVLLGGGISKKFDKYAHIIDIDGMEIEPAELLNDAGSIGAALFAAQKTGALN